MKIVHAKCKWYKNQFYFLPTISWHDASPYYMRKCWFIEFKWLGLEAAVMLMKDGELKNVGGWIWTSKNAPH